MTDSEDPSPDRYSSASWGPEGPSSASGGAAPASRKEPVGQPPPPPPLEPMFDTPSIGTRSVGSHSSVAPEGPDGGSRGRKRSWIKSLAALCVAVAVGFAGYQTGRRGADDRAALPPAAATSGAGSQSRSAPLVREEAGEPVADVAEAVTPAVVQIETGTGVGSGFVYDASGLVLTNAHVVAGESRVLVRFADGSEAEGEVVGSEPEVDTAVVRVPRSRVRGVAALGLGVEVRVGQLAVAIGSPFDLSNSVTAGVVSAVGRPLGTSLGAAQLTVGMIQTDAPINPGNSGGPLVDRRGRVIGMNTAIFSQTGESAGIGFAIPIDIAHQAAQAIVQGRDFKPGRLGVVPGRRIDGEPGALVMRVMEGSSAERAGIEVGDVIVAVDGERVRDGADLAVKITRRQEGDVVRLEVLRSGKTRVIEVRLGGV
ncbi:MAG: hypothetical protein KatS3mg008_0706 [Acidimicrobiales bacterium]|nr:MAG: hypothetical protein KatS3mg008_0706 [Acidimicrobiales bacterium]